MALVAGAAGGAPVARARGGRPVAAFAGLVALLLLLSSVPLLLSPPVGLALRGPSLVPAGEEVAFEGRFSLAGIGLGGALVEVYLDDEIVARLATAPDGSFTATLRAPVGPHTLRASAAPGAYTAAHTVPLSFRAVEPPEAPRDLRAENGALRWAAPPEDADRPVQAYRVYAQTAGGPWAEVATLDAGATSHAVAAQPGARFSVAAANVAGESPWSGPIAP